ncbi:MAG: sialidase family protein [bacterium]
MSVGISEDLGKTFTKKKVEISGVNSYDAVDPHAELINGKIVLYYLGDFSTNMRPGSKFKIYSAGSSDGISFSDVIEVHAFDEVTTDPDVFETAVDMRMLVSQERNLELLVSTDEGETFEEVKNFTWSKGGVSDTIEIDGEYYTHYCDAGISRATGADEGTLTEEKIGALDDGGQGNIICDPSIIQLPDESYVMYYKMQEAPQKDLHEPPM